MQYEVQMRAADDPRWRTVAQPVDLTTAMLRAATEQRASTNDQVRLVPSEPAPHVDMTV